MRRIVLILLLAFMLTTIGHGEIFNIFSEAKISLEGKKNFSYRKVDGTKRITATENSTGNPSNNSLNSYYIENKELEESAGLKIIISLFDWLNFYGEGGKTENTRISSSDYYNYYGNLNQENANPGLYGLAGGEIIFFNKKKIKMKLGYERKETEYKKIVTKTEYSSTNNWGGSENKLERKSEEEKYLLKIVMENGLYAGTGYSAYKSKYTALYKNYYNYNYSGYSSYSYNNESREEMEVFNKSKISYFIGYSAPLGKSFSLDTKVSFGDEVGINVGLRLIL